MRLKKILATTTLTSAVSLGALGLGGGVASADPPGPPAPPWVPGHGHNHDGPRPRDNRHDNGPGDSNRHNNVRGDWDIGGRDWWRGRPDKRWRDSDLPPWGFWGPPPPAHWAGRPPWVDPHPINYWGYTVTPVWDDGFHAWGIWLFGIFIPIVGIV